MSSSSYFEIDDMDIISASASDVEDSAAPQNSDDPLSYQPLNAITPRDTNATTTTTEKTTKPPSLQIGTTSAIGELADINLTPSHETFSNASPLASQILVPSSSSTLATKSEGIYDDMSDFMYSTDEGDSLLEELQPVSTSTSPPSQPSELSNRKVIKVNQHHQSARLTSESQLDSDNNRPLPSPIVGGASGVGGKMVVVLGRNEAPLIRLRKDSSSSITKQSEDSDNSNEDSKHAHEIDDDQQKTWWQPFDSYNYTSDNHSVNWVSHFTRTFLISAALTVAVGLCFDYAISGSSSTTTAGGNHRVRVETHRLPKYSRFY